MRISVFILIEIILYYVHSVAPYKYRMLARICLLLFIVGGVVVAYFICGFSHPTFYKTKIMFEINVCLCMTE